jgi:hypothetical protein
MLVEALRDYDPERRRVYLEDMLARAEEAIVQAQMRIERHGRLATVDGEPWQRRLHLDLQINLQEGMKLLRLQRAMVLHELYGPKIPRRCALGVNFNNKSKSERIDKLRETIAWLDTLPKDTLAMVIAAQRQRAMDELTQLQTEALPEID